jgi:hypothetical protein
MPKASKKTKDELYSLISKMIMDCRIEVKKELASLGIAEAKSDSVDAILYRLNTSCPQSAINYFEDTK